MRDDEGRSAVHGRLHGFADLRLCAGAHARGRLIENEDWGVAKKHPRYREKLPLPNGYVGRVVVERGVIALRQSLDEIVDPRHFGGLLDFLARGVFLPIGDVFRDRAGEEPRVLQHHPEVAPQICPRELCCWDAVNPDVPAVDLVKAHEEVDERRFPILILTILKKPIREFLK